MITTRMRITTPADDGDTIRPTGDSTRSAVDMSRPTVALFGATGAVGLSIGAALRQQGRPYRVVGRDANRLQQVFGSDPKASPLTWDPDSPSSVRAAADGIDTLVYLLGVDYTRFDLHPALMRKTLDGAIAAGVRHLILIASVYPYGRPRSTPIREDHPRAPHTVKGRLRKAQEDLLFEAQTQGRIRVTVLRLPDFYGPGVRSSLLHRAVVAAARGGTADLLGPIDRPHEFVYVPDVGPVVVRLIETPVAQGRVWHLAGAGVTTQRELLDMLQAQTRRRLKTRVLGRTMLRWMGLVSPMLRELAEMSYLMTDPVILDDTALRQVIGPIHKTPYPEGIRQTLAAASGLR